MVDADIIIIGAGIAGASAAFELTHDYKVLVLEREDQPGYHSTGRSAALFHAYYGHENVRRLAGASRAFLESPPGGFCEYDLLTDRGVLEIACLDQVNALEKEFKVIKKLGGPIERVEQDDLLKLVPSLREGYAVAGIYDPSAKDIDVSSLHAGYLKFMKQQGGTLLTNTEVIEIKSLDEGWVVKTNNEELSCKIVVNAAGAWGGKIGALAGTTEVNLTPMRRTAFLFDPPSELDISKWPMTFDIDEQFYFKPDSGKLLVSPADQTPLPPQDARPDDVDIATAVERVEAATTLQIRHLSHKWAGLRTFTDDRVPLAGFDSNLKNFFWLVGQGGYGIMTSPAMGACCASLIREGDIPQQIKESGLTKEALSPKRLKPAN